MRERVKRLPHATAMRPRMPCIMLAAQEEWHGEVIHLSWKPRAFLYKKFLTDEECDYLKAKVGECESCVGAVASGARSPRVIGASLEPLGALLVALNIQHLGSRGAPLPTPAAPGARSGPVSPTSGFALLNPTHVARPRGS